MKHFQNKFATIILLAVTIITCTHCSPQSKLPGSWQPSMELKITYGGGMRDYSYEIAIKDTGSYRLVNDEGKETRTPLSFTKKELDELIGFLKSKLFDRIDSKMRNGIVNDMGTTNITLHWDTKKLGASIGATTDIEEADKENYAAIVAYINKLAGNK